MYELKKIAPGMYEIPKTEGMRVPGLVIANEKLLKELDIERPLEQVKNVAYLPGIVGYSIAMPDIHWGYGFPIGGVAAMDENGVISPGGVGYDINCGVRLAVLPVLFKDIKDKAQSALIKKIFEIVPSGVGRGQKNIRGLSERDYQELLVQGAKWSVHQGCGLEKDLEHIESNGCIEGANFDAISEMAKKRGKNQLGSIGSGNHFVEMGEIQEIFSAEVAKAWGLETGLTYVLIHSGSRGFGHQVCQDTLNTFIKAGYAENLPDKQLVAAPIQSSDGQRYFQAMAAAANFAFNNRQQILHEVRLAIKDVLNIPPEEVFLLYDVCHNIAKFETYDVDGVQKKLCIHRKGATRAFGPGAKELAQDFQKTGQPVMVPGDMGRASYILSGLGNPLTWCSCCHGAGRARSRIQSSKAWRQEDPTAYMKTQGVEVLASSRRTISEEMPDAYKDVESVVDAVQEAKLANKVARLKPGCVIKG